MIRWLILLCACSFWISAPLGADFYTTPGTVVNGQISEDGKIVLLKTYDGKFKSYRWFPSTDPVNLGDMKGGAGYTIATYMTPDGNTIVGYGSSDDGDSEAFRWTVEGGLRGLGAISPGRFQSEAVRCSDDGNVVIGKSGAFPPHAVHWTALSGMEKITGFPEGYDRPYAMDCSNDGMVIVGSMDLESGTQSYIWKLVKGPGGDDVTSIQGLGLLQNSTGALTRENSPLVCSSDASEIIGFGYDQLHGLYYGPVSIWRWDEASKFTDLMEAHGSSFLGGSPPLLKTSAVVAEDLKTVVAGYTSGSGDGILRWREDYEVDELEIPGKSAAAMHVSSDGRFVAGTVMGWDDVPYAVIWGPNGRTHILEDILEEAGVDIGDLSLASANAISNNGRHIAGAIVASFNDPTAFHVSLPSHPFFDEVVGDIWKQSPWYGTYASYGDATIWHLEHGWQQFIIGKYGTVYVYDHALESWLWTSYDYYPLMYMYGTANGWVEYIPPEEEGRPRQFLIIATGEIIYSGP